MRLGYSVAFPPQTKFARWAERTNADVSVVMLRILDYRLKGFHVVYSDGSSKTASSTSTASRIGGYGWPALGDYEIFSTISDNVL